MIHEIKFLLLLRKIKFTLQPLWHTYASKHLIWQITEPELK